MTYSHNSRTVRSPERSWRWRCARCWEGEAVKEYPIMFTGEMVRAILDGRKTQTRRCGDRWARVKAGDRMWVRETHMILDGEIFFRATDPGWDEEGEGIWRPSIYMRRMDSRITLEVVSNQEERVREISEADAKSEGCCVGVGSGYTLHRAAFHELWNSINGKKPGRSWADNPVVHVIEFKWVKP